MTTLARAWIVGIGLLLGGVAAPAIPRRFQWVREAIPRESQWDSASSRLNLRHPADAAGSSQRMAQAAIHGNLRGTAPAAMIGDLGRQIGEPELAEIARLGSTNAIQPWLFVVQRGHFAREEFVYVYFAPTIDTPEIRRGTRALVSRRYSESKKAWEGWKLNGKGWYAQVAVPGRDFTRIEGERDVNLPFGVGSVLSNDDLVSLAKLVRSSPSRSGASVGERVEGNWPINSIERKPDGLVVIQTRKDRSSGQVVKLRLAQKQWQIIAIGTWME